MRRENKRSCRQDNALAYPVIDVEDTDKLPAAGGHHFRLPGLKLNVPNLSYEAQSGAKKTSTSTYRSSRSHWDVVFVVGPHEVVRLKFEPITR